jgi:hypothetical protein
MEAAFTLATCNVSHYSDPIFSLSFDPFTIV